MSFDGDQRATAQFLALLLENPRDVLPDVGGADVIKPKLDDTAQRRATGKEKLCEIEILCQHHCTIFVRPAKNLRVRSVGRTEFTPMARDVTAQLNLDSAVEAHPEAG